jgi:hypothetical protein
MRSPCGLRWGICGKGGPIRVFTRLPKCLGGTLARLVVCVFTRKKKLARPATALLFTLFVKLWSHGVAAGNGGSRGGSDGGDLVVGN